MSSCFRSVLTASVTALLAGSVTAQAAGAPPGLSYSNGHLRLSPPPGATVTHYALHYITPERLAAGERWGIWARQWPPGVTDIDLAAAQTETGCEALGAGALCHRPPALGEHRPGQTFLYRAYAQTGGEWSAASPILSVTRP